MQRRTLLQSAAVGTFGVLAAGGYWALRPRAADTGAGGAADDVCIVAPTFAYDPASGLAPTAAREVPAQARCPVCGMYPARQRRWAAQVIFSDGQVQFLDSPLSLFLYLQRVERYAPGRRTDQIAAVYVSDLGSGAWLDMDEAFYVHGSSQLGPMRAGNLPAFGSRAAAVAFIAQHGGEALGAATLRRGLPPSLQQLAPHLHADHAPSTSRQRP